MFASRKTIAERMADAVDLAIDFATLGEYGLEPVAEPPRCERRARARREAAFAWPARTDRLAARA
jgi:hypothetical protein